MSAENPYEPPQAMGPSGASPKDRVQIWRRIAIGGLAALAVISVGWNILINLHFHKVATARVGLLDDELLNTLDLAFMIAERITAAVAGIALLGWFVAWAVAKRRSPRKARSTR